MLTTPTDWQCRYEVRFPDGEYRIENTRLQYRLTHFQQDVLRTLELLKQEHAELLYLSANAPNVIEEVQTVRRGILGFLLGPKRELRLKYSNILVEAERVEKSIEQLGSALRDFEAFQQGKKGDPQIEYLAGTHWNLLHELPVRPEKITIDAYAAFVLDQMLFRVADGSRLACGRCKMPLWRTVGIRIWDTFYCYSCAKRRYDAGQIAQSSVIKDGIEQSVFRLVFREDCSEAATREQILNRDASACQSCGFRYGAEYLEVHHALPRSKGGDERWSNLITLCKYCHDREVWFGHVHAEPTTKGMTLQQFQMLCVPRHRSAEGNQHLMQF